MSSTMTSLPLEKRYQRLGLIGKGAYGEVYAARVASEADSVELGVSHVALKEIARSKVEWNEHAVQNLWRERTLLKSRIKRGCVNIARLLDSYTTSTDVFLVFELIEGGTLWQHLMLCRERRQEARVAEEAHDGTEGMNSKGDPTRSTWDWDLQKVAYCLRQICVALGYLHGLKIAYRDLKCPNVMVDANKKMLKLVDMGFATDEHPCTDAVGTMRNMAPEVVEGAQDEATTYNGFLADIWSVGAVGYELYTIGKPFLEGFFEDIHMDGPGYSKAVEKSIPWLQTQFDAIEKGNAQSDSIKTAFYLSFLRSTLVRDPAKRVQSVVDVISCGFLAQYGETASFDGGVGFRVANLQPDSGNAPMPGRGVRGRNIQIRGGGGEDVFQGF